MLDTDTKRRIDTARDILVGKVPDPKSQVEQITIALIYKFMHDMDQIAEESGGKRTFFAGDFSRYAWPKLMSPEHGGQEVLNLYAEAITKMPQNAGIPPLFRDIFKNAFLPYRDPETLRLFLKEIDGFTYDHSERLGDAFEYLLSVLGSQGDAGQFRTPRHIIDFIVKLVDPKKTDRILDPACGTAGFLISAYKHILNANQPKKGRGGKTSGGLTPDEKARLGKNLVGYDISPDMVRLSLVNLYLHGFTSPNVEEYDTLTSEEHWNEQFDVILANPPFMSPKGGIKPHNRFTVTSKRSEVLFVDYIAEHLASGGRAGIIVPEGIIFQSQNAYKKLRKILIEESLVAVISLPQGVFNPYSGVKTSILILDHARAKRLQHVLFCRIDDDGFDLGAKRKATDGTDLDRATQNLRAWLSMVDSGNSVDQVFAPDDKFALLVNRQEILSSEDFGLVADRYRSHDNSRDRGIVWESLGNILVPSRSGKVGAAGDPPVLSITMKKGLVDQSEKFNKRIASDNVSSYKLVMRDELVVGFPIDEGVLGIQRLYDIACVSPAYDIWGIRSKCVNLDFLEKLLRSNEARRRYRLWMRGTAGRRRTIEKKDFLKIEIPLPPLSVQRALVSEVTGYQAVIDGARAVLDNYRPYIPINPEWPIVDLSELSEFKNGLNYKADESGNELKIIGVGDFKSDLFAPISSLRSIQLDQNITDDYLVREGDLLFVRSNGNPDLVGRSLIVPELDERVTFSGFTIRARIKDTVRAWPMFLAHYFKSSDFSDHMKTVGQGVNIRNLSQSILKGLQIPLPPVDTQRALVEEIEHERRLVDSNRELITRMQQKIDNALARVWGEDNDANADADEPGN